MCHLSELSTVLSWKSRRLFYWKWNFFHGHKGTEEINIICDVMSKKNYYCYNYYRVKIKESGQRFKYLDLAREQKKTMEYEGDGDNNRNWYTSNSLQRLGKCVRKAGHQKTSRNYPKCNIVENGQNNEKTPENLSSLAVTQTLEKNNQLTLLWKTRKE